MKIYDSNTNLKNKCSTTIIAIYFILSLSWLFSSQSFAASVDITTSKPLADGVVVITVSFGGVTKKVSVKDIKSTYTEEEKRAAIVLELIANGFDVDTSAQLITIKNLRDGTEVKFSSISTGEGSDSLKATNTDSSIEFDGLFEQYDSLGNESTYLAGFSSTLGEVSQTFLSSELTALTGTSIASAFYDSLFAPANLIGINLSLVGSRIISSYTNGVFGEAIEFGTTSSTGTVSGIIQTVPAPASFSLFISALIGLIIFRKKQ